MFMEFIGFTVHEVYIKGRGLVFIEFIGLTA